MWFAWNLIFYWAGKIKSRNSTFKRQKQYFEQRKRMLQKNATGSETPADGDRPSSRSWESNSSLDILSLANVSNLAQEPTARISNENEVCLENDEHTLDHYYAARTHAAAISERSPIIEYELKEEGTPFSKVTTTDYSKPVSVRLSCHDESLAGNENKSYPSNLSTAQEISVFDLITDETSNGARESPVHIQENHLSFSLEGLGNSKMVSPLHSPKTPGRSISRCSSPLERFGKKSNKFLRLNYSFDDFGLDFDFSVSPSSRKDPFCSRSMSAVDCSRRGHWSPRNSTPFNWTAKKRDGIFADSKDIHDIHRSSRHIWDDLCSPDDMFNILGDHESSGNVFGQSDIDHIFCAKNLSKKDSIFNEHTQWSERSYIRTPRIDRVDLPYLHQEPRFIEKSPDSRRFSLGLDHDVLETINSFEQEDGLSLPSEESCSYTAVMDSAKKHERNQSGRRHA